ncbi:MAG: flagellar hook-length control protein FliK [Magnetococcales bacterium]|nr:flagellar hook-length control protein FliK [Magnetococcales bacterium]
MIPLSMPLAEATFANPANSAPVQPSNQSHPDEDFSRMLEKASNSKKTGARETKPSHGQEVASNTASKPRDATEAKQADTANKKADDDKAALMDNAQDKKDVAKSIDAADKKDDLNQQINQKADAAKKADNEQITTDADQEQLDDAQRIEAAQWVKQRKKGNTEDPKAGVNPWSVILNPTPVGTPLLSPTPGQATVGGNQAPLLTLAMDGGKGGGTVQGGTNKGGWTVTTVEMALAGVKAGHTTAEQTASQQTAPVATDPGLQGLRVNTSSQVIQYAAKPMPAYSPTFGEDLAEQLGSLRMISRPGMNDQVRINLVPRELGTLDVRLTVDDQNRVHMLITTESDAARDLLNKQMPQLRDALASQNLGLGAIQVQVDQRQRGDQSANQGFEWHEGQKGTLTADTGTVSSTAVPVAQTNRPWSPGQGLSVFA